jgi:hypothetical protein
MSDGYVCHVNEQIEGAVYIGRANGRLALKGSPLANTFVIGRHGDRAFCLTCYRSKLRDGLRQPAIVDALIAARGKPLACWCRRSREIRTDESACHADVILELLGRYTDDELRGFVNGQAA